jgi:hypothetical protein
MSDELVKAIASMCRGELAKCDRIMAECKSVKPCSACTEVLTHRTFPREVLELIERNI